MTDASPGRFPFTSFPDGWFFFELSHNIPPGQLVGKQWMRRQVVGWRNHAGQICIADAFCPHLGARLSPETGGAIQNGNLVCPFHGFTYDVSGACVSTPNAPPTPACRLDLFPVQEVNGFIFAWFDTAAREPLAAAGDGRSGLDTDLDALVPHPLPPAGNH